MMKETLMKLPIGSLPYSQSPLPPQRAELMLWHMTRCNFLVRYMSSGVTDGTDCFSHTSTPECIVTRFNLDKSIYVTSALSSISLLSCL